METWDETRLDKELGALMDEVPEAVDLEKKIEEAIQRKIKRVVVRTMAILGTGILVLILLVNPLLNAMFLNPYKLNKASYEASGDARKLDTQMDTKDGYQDEGYEEELSVFQGVLRDYWETMQPYTEVIGVEVEKKGFSRYELSMQVVNHRGYLNIGVHNIWCEMVFGEYKNWKDADQMLVRMMGRFGTTWNEKETYIEEIKELPESAVVYLSIGEKEAKEYDRLKETLQGHQIDLEWIQVYQPNAEFQGGLNLNFVAAWRETDKRDDMNGEQLLQVYRSNLESLMNNIEIWKPFGLFCNSTIFMNERGVLEKTYQDAKQIDTLMCKNYCIYGKKDVIVTYLESLEADSMQVDEVKLSSFK